MINTTTTLPIEDINYMTSIFEDYLRIKESIKLNAQFSEIISQSDRDVPTIQDNTQAYQKKLEADLAQLQEHLGVVLDATNYPKVYEVWALGYDSEGNATDAEEFLEAFSTLEVARAFTNIISSFRHQVDIEHPYFEVFTDKGLLDPTCPKEIRVEEVTTSDNSAEMAYSLWLNE